jgi:hypothetical protein
LFGFLRFRRIGKLCVHNIIEPNFIAFRQVYGLPLQDPLRPYTWSGPTHYVTTKTNSCIDWVSLGHRAEIVSADVPRYMDRSRESQVTEPRSSLRMCLGSLGHRAENLSADVPITLLKSCYRLGTERQTIQRYTCM